MSDKLKIECFLEAIGEYVAARQDGDAEAMKRAAILAERQIEEAVNECVAELVTVEEVAKAICLAQFPGFSQEDIEQVKDGTVLWHAYRKSAEAVMNLLRRE